MKTTRNTTISTPYDLLNRYLQDVRKYLPQSGNPSRQQDILEELSANILAQIEDKEAELGRTLTQDEVAAIVKQHGHPMRVAGRYLPQQYLIGPTMLPVYWYVLKMALFVALLVYAVANAAILATGALAPVEIVDAFLKFPGVALTVFAWVTLIFAGLDFAVVRYRVKLGPLESWDPNTLPRVSRSRQWKIGWQGALELLPGVLALLYWLIAVPNHRFLIFGPGALFLTFSPAVQSIYWPISLLLVVQLALDGLGLWYGAESRLWRGKGVIAKVISLGIFAILLKTNTLIAAAAPVAHLVKYQFAAIQVNFGIMLGIKIAFVLTSLLLLLDLGRLAWTGMSKRLNL